jgi:hypothetical protein
MLMVLMTHLSSLLRSEMKKKGGEGTPLGLPAHGLRPRYP